MSWAYLFAVDRNLNIALAVVATWALVYRIVWVIRHSSDRDHGLRWMWALAAYVATSGLAAAQYAALTAPAGPVSLIFTGLHLTVIGLAVRPPSRLGGTSVISS